MVIEVNIADGTIENGRVVDWANPEQVEVVGYDYDIAEEDADDETIDRDESGTQRYVSSVTLFKDQ
jgi:hypothetical protein